MQELFEFGRQVIRTFVIKKRRRAWTSTRRLPQAPSIVTLVQTDGGEEKLSGAIAASVPLATSARGAIFNSLRTAIAHLTMG